MKLPDLKQGDQIMVGKWKNRLATITGFDTDKNGQPVVKTDKGDYPVFHFRVKKLMSGESMTKAEQLLSLCEAISTDDIHSRIDYEQKELAPIRKQINDLHNKRKDLDIAAYDSQDPEQKKHLKAESDKISAEIEKLGAQRKAKEAQLDAEWKTIVKRRHPKAAIITQGGSYTKSGKRIK